MKGVSNQLRYPCVLPFYINKISLKKTAEPKLRDNFEEYVSSLYCECEEAHVSFSYSSLTLYLSFPPTRLVQYVFFFPFWLDAPSFPDVSIISSKRNNEFSQSPLFFLHSSHVFFRLALRIERRGEKELACNKNKKINGC